MSNHKQFENVLISLSENLSGEAGNYAESFLEYFRKYGSLTPRQTTTTISLIKQLAQQEEIIDTFKKQVPKLLKLKETQTVLRLAN